MADSNDAKGEAPFYKGIIDPEEEKKSGEAINDKGADNQEKETTKSVKNKKVVDDIDEGVKPEGEDDTPPKGQKKSKDLSPSPSGTSKAAPEKPGCCSKWWNGIFKCVANDAIYGSFFGPHPVSYNWCLCGCCKPSCVRPFLLASVVTKLMWFIMFVFVAVFCCFLIPHYETPTKDMDIVNFVPCRNKTVYNAQKLGRNCNAHGGYFMVYRTFLSYEILLLLSCFIMINVKSTKKNKKRAKMHHGFWLYKYIILFVLLLSSYLGILVFEGGLFEAIMSYTGLLAVIIFSFVELTFILDVLELLFRQSNRISPSDWAVCKYWTLCMLFLAVDLTMIVFLFTGYIFKDKHPYADGRGATNSSTNTTKKVQGEVDGSHLGIAISALVLNAVLFGLGIFNQVKKRTTGLLESSVTMIYITVIIWEALGNSPGVTSRPKFTYHTFPNPSELRKGNQDTYFKSEAALHGVTSLVALIYYIFWDGPRSTTAPLSLLFDKIFNKCAKKPEVPVIPPFTKESVAKFENEAKRVSTTSQGSKKGLTEDEGPGSKRTSDTPSERSQRKPDTPSDQRRKVSIEDATMQSPEDEFATAIKERKVYDDEKYGVRYSWSMFYVFMMLGSLSVMMGMTNLADPWAEDWYSSSYPAMGTKLFIAIFNSFLFIGVTTFARMSTAAQVSPETYDEPEQLEQSESAQAV